MYFGSDNQTGASPKVLGMLVEANNEYTHGYGDDRWTDRAIEALKAAFECDLEAYFVATGTAANSLALSCMVQPWEAILCHDSAHIILDESTAPELFTGGARMLSVSNGQGKITPEHLENYFQTIGTDYPHNVRATALSITQASESGLVYTPTEISALSRVAKGNGLSVHMDGARFANALVTLGITPAQMTWQAGIDVLSFGGTKNGCLAAEVVIFFKPELVGDFPFLQKRAGQLLSKSRFISAQFEGYLADDVWLRNARQANTMAQRLSQGLDALPGIELAYPTQSNEVFVRMPRSLIKALAQQGIKVNDEELDGKAMRFVTAWDTSETEVDDLLMVLTAQL